MLPLALAFALSAVLTAAVTVFAWHRRETPLFRMNAFVGFWIVALDVLNVIQILTPGPAGARLVVSSGILVMHVIVAGVLCLSMTVADRAWRVSRRIVAWLAVVPLLLLGLLVSDPWSGWFYTAMVPVDPYGMFVPVPGPGYWVSAVYIYGLLTASMVRVARVRHHAPRDKRKLYDWTLAAFVPPIVVNIAGMPMHGRTVDMTAIGLAVTMLIVYGALARSLPQYIQVAHRQVFDTIADAVAVIDESGRILDVNAAARALMRKAGLPEGPSGTPIADFLGLDFVLSENADTEQTLTDVLGRGADLHLRISPLHDRRGRCIGWALVARDITEANRRRREAEESNVRLREQLETIEALRADLVEQAVRDTLTGLYNRRHLMEILAREIPRAAGEGTPLSVALIDVDHFKRINDTHGHDAGDVVLTHVAALLAGEVRHDDVVVRYGGEEFVLLLPGAGAEEARARLDDLRRRVGRTPVEVEGRHLTVTFSAGVADLAPGQGPRDLLREADRALYGAKRLGRDRVELAAAHPPRALESGPGEAA
ncbi:diguanylate cyclase [Planobispora siamensis]|uniref:PAS domain S-box-containing protein/diguanylate cyclase (GGDEF) domain-containing protein n=1 Tax=Planobispora siamensis TaxID=936338 RepID=A0A8J3WIG4_9ACTN|nr:diguanylate cyclase [Planobispora siamensis]GIH91744.1 hypothetical protein Psi01_23740 [Planobispora siamensis]